MKRVAIGGIVHETNLFSDISTTISSFKNSVYYSGDSIINEYKDGNSSISGVLEGLSLHGHEPVPLIYSAATPSGIVSYEAFNSLLDELKESIRAAVPIDGVILVLHGAMIADGIPDCEGVILGQLRKIIGADIPLVTVLDFHANLSDDMFNESDALIGYDYNPHTDCFDKGLEAVEIINELFIRKPQLVRCMIKVPLLLSPINNWTSANPFSQVIPRIKCWEEKAEIMCMSAFGGYIYADSKDICVSVIAYGWDWDIINNAAKSIAYELWNLRMSVLYHGLSVETAIEYALFSDGKPILLADLGDNIGAGSFGDCTHILSVIMSMGIEGFVTTICDPEAAKVKDVAFKRKIGGNSKWSGESVMLEGEVIFRSDGKYSLGKNNHFSAMSGRVSDMGECIVVKAKGNIVLITSRPTPVGGPEIFEHTGIDLQEYKIVAIKGAAAFRAGFSSISKHVLEVDTPGVTTCDISRLPYKCEAVKEMFPLNVNCVWDFS